MDIFLRYAAETDYLPNPFFTRAYDARILYILSGEGELRLPDQSHPLRHGTLCYYPAGQAYWPVSSAHSPLRFVTVNFDFDRSHAHVSRTLPPVAAESYQAEQAILSHDSCEFSIYKQPLVRQGMHRLQDDFLSISNLFKCNLPHGKEAAAARLSSLLWILPDTTETPPPPAFSKAVAYVAEHYADIRSNTDLGLALHYHPYHLNRLFRRHTGKTLHRYLLEFRLEKAAHLLSETSLSVADIADAVGFENADHFSHCFTQVHGVPPTQYRRGTRFV